MKVLIDTNVVLDFCLNRERSKYAKKIFEAVEAYKLVGVIGAQSIPTIYFYLQSELSHQQAMDFIKDMTNKILVLDLTEKIVKDSIKLEFTDYEDALLAETAFKQNCDYIITNNIKDFKKSKVLAVKPDLFIKKYL